MDGACARPVSGPASHGRPRTPCRRPGDGGPETAKAQQLADARDVHIPQLLLERRDLVPNARRELELKLASGTEHLLVQLLNQLREIGTGHAGRGRYRGAPLAAAAR